MQDDLLQRFAQDWTCRHIRNRSPIFTDRPKSLHALAESPHHTAPDALLIVSPAGQPRLAAALATALAKCPLPRVSPDRFRQLIDRSPAKGIAALVRQREGKAPGRNANGLWLALRHVPSGKFEPSYAPRCSGRWRNHSARWYFRPM